MTEAAANICHENINQLFWKYANIHMNNSRATPVRVAQFIRYLLCIVTLLKGKKIRGLEHVGCIFSSVVCKFNMMHLRKTQK